MIKNNKQDIHKKANGKLKANVTSIIREN